MNRENVQKWIAALRSGKYKKCKRYLHEGYLFCAIGVACDIFDPSWEEDWGVRNIYRHQGDFLTSSPNENVQAHYGLNLATFNRIAEMNDNGYSFNHIADYLEEQLNNE